MILVGIAGGVGAGKSTVAEIFEDKGAQVLDADRLAHTFLEKGTEEYHSLVAAFGEAVLDSEGRIDRISLAQEAFSAPKNVEKLNRIIHPRLVGEIRERVKEAGKKGSGVFVVDAALLFDWGIEGLFDLTIDVESESGVQRAAERMSMDEEELKKRKAVQMSSEERRRRADVVIENDSSIEELKKETEKLWNTMVARK